MKKIIYVGLCVMISVFLMGCTAKEDKPAITTEAVTKTPETEVQETEAISSEIILNYPKDMQALGFTEPVILEGMPTNVVSITVAPVLAMYELGIDFAAVPSSMVVRWPDDIDAETLPSVTSENFDIELVVALNPDLVVMGYTSADTHGATLTELGIPVYYVTAGHVASYESVKMQTAALIEGLAVTEEAKAAGENIMNRFAELETKLEELKAIYADKKVMVLQSSPPAHYIQTSGGTLGSMFDMMGFENVYTNASSSMVQLDLEVALEYNPDLVVCVGMSPTGEAHKAVMDEDQANNPEYWGSIDAFVEGNVIYLPVGYVSTAGINLIDIIQDLMDTVEAHYN